MIEEKNHLFCDAKTSTNNRFDPQAAGGSGLGFSTSVHCGLTLLSTPLSSFALCCCCCSNTGDDDSSWPFVSRCTMGIGSCTVALGDLVADSCNFGKLLPLFDCGDMAPLSVVDEGDVSTV